MGTPVNVGPIQGEDNGTTGYGVLGSSPSLIGVRGVVGSAGVTRMPGPAAPTLRAGVVGYGYSDIGGTEVEPIVAATYGVYGSGSGDGVYGNGTNGVHGSSAIADGYGVLGENSAGTGVRGVIGAGSGQPQGPTLAGVWGDSADGNGVYGSSIAWNGVEGDSWSPAHAGVAGQNNAGGPGIWGSSSGNAGQFEGNVLVTGTITVGGDVVLQNADCAEDFDTAESDIEVGTVVVMGDDGAVHPCGSAYATTVVGVISGAGGLRPGITLDKRESVTPRMPVALMGKVYCKADATSSPISVGDLLTTSEIPGYAMRASDPSRAFGAVIGKALGPLAEGQGLIPVLVALQ